MKTKIINGEVCIISRWTQTCSGCFNSIDGQPDGDYSWDDKAKCYVGAGCHECGYTGKRRIEMWLPKTAKDHQ